MARRYLHDELNLSCDNSEVYEATRNTAVVMIILWPVGVPLFYAGLLAASRDALMKGDPTPLSGVTSLLAGDYKAHLFWWEPLEMCRKLTLTGAPRPSLAARV